jgi:hypothetical protein
MEERMPVEHSPAHAAAVDMGLGAGVGLSRAGVHMGWFCGSQPNTTPYGL